MFDGRNSVKTWRCSGNLKSLVVLLIVFSLLLFIPSVMPVSYAESKGATIKDIQNTLRTLEDEYIKEVDSLVLLEGAYKGINEYLVLKKIQPPLSPISSDRTFEANMRAFASMYDKIIADNGSRVDENEMVYSSLRGMMKVLEDKYQDPYTVAMTAKEYQNLEESLNARGFGGVGIYIELDKNADNTIMVVEPIEDTPAQKAGIKSGDHIIRINDVSTKGMSLDGVSNRIRGPVGTSVTITIARKGVAKPFDVTLTRANITVKSLTYEMKKGNIGYIKLRSFGDTTGREMEKALDNLEKQGAQGLIMDLRNNGGGYIQSAVDVCSNFLEEDTVVTSVVNYRKGIRDVDKSFGTSHKRLPLVVLVNGYSASASEITAGCFQDLEIATLVGVKTFGKGSVQTISRLPGGGAIKYTIAHYLTPSGRDINKKGIEPDIVVEMDPSLMGTEQDTQIQKALQILTSKISQK